MHFQVLLQHLNTKFREKMIQNSSKFFSKFSTVFQNIRNQILSNYFETSIHYALLLFQ